MQQFYDQLLEYVLDGEEDEAVALTRAQIEAGTSPLEIVQKCLVPILDDIGDRFARLELFLPDLVMSADVAKAVKDEIRAHLLGAASGAQSAGKVVIGTVQGDVHDIGKNIVATLLEVNGYEVIDLGNDVQPYSFIETARREKVDIIALSSLLTTSMPYMADKVQEIGINTLPVYRGQGYASAACSVSAQNIVAGGRCPQWSCREDNMASFRLAVKVGFVKFADVLTVTL